MTILTTDVTPPDFYDRVYRTLHWSIAVLFITALVLGYWAGTLPPGQGIRPALLGVHKSLGMTVLVLAIVRLTYRLSVRPPALPAKLGLATRLGATAAHWLLYLVMILMPVTGYLFSTAGGHDVGWFGLFQFPRLIVNAGGSLQHFAGAIMQH